MTERPLVSLVQGAVVSAAAMAVVKLTLAASAGSAALLAEGLHAVAALASHVLLMVQLLPKGPKRVGARAGALVFWSLAVPALVYPLAAGVAFNEAMTRLADPTPPEASGVWFVPLAAAAVLHLLLLRAAARVRGGGGAHRIGFGDPVPRAIGIASVGGLAGSAIAALGVGLSMSEIWPAADAWAALGCGLVMGWVAGASALAVKGALAYVPDVAVAGEALAGPVTASAREGARDGMRDERAGATPTRSEPGRGAAGTATAGLVEVREAGAQSHVSGGMASLGTGGAARADSTPVAGAG